MLQRPAVCQRWHAPAWDDKPLLLQQVHIVVHYSFEHL
jgi:hypothetical protein